MTVKSQKDQAIRNLETDIRNLKKAIEVLKEENNELSGKIRIFENEKKDMSQIILSYDDLIKAYRAVIIDMGRALDHEQKQPFFADKIFVFREGRKLYLK
jgi:chromosome segregation ATPase